MTDVLRQVWVDATTAGPVPGPAVSLVLAVAGLVLARLRVLRHAVTVVHEAGHALVAVLVGRRVTGIRLHADASGLTLSRGRPRGPGMVATLLAGYPAPTVLALVGVVVVSRGYAVGLLWAFALATAVLVLLVRNLYGLLVLLGLGAAVSAVGWFLPPTATAWLALLLVWTLLLAAPGPVLALLRPSGRRDPGSDPAQLARLTGVPRVLWLLLLLLLTGGGAVLGAVLLLGV